MLWCGAALAAPPAVGDATSGGAGTTADRPDLPFVTVFPARDWTPEGIVGGSVVTDSHPNIVALGALDPATGEATEFCSGSQIADDWVLTAAHCVLAANQAASYCGPACQPYVLYGNSILNGGYTDAVAWTEWFSNPLYDAAGFTNDSGLVHMAETRPEVKWMVLNDSPLDKTWVGTEVTYFGYGITSDGGSGEGILRTTMIPVSTVNAFNFETFANGTNLCNGDSGGPGTYEGPDGPKQLGVNAYITPTCVGGTGGSTRVDTQIPFISTHVTTFATDYDQLPHAATGGDTGGRDWLDFGVGDGLPGVDSRFSDPHHQAGGCDTTGTGPVLGLLGAAALLIRARSRAPRR